MSAICPKCGVDREKGNCQMPMTGCPPIVAPSSTISSSPTDKNCELIAYLDKQAYVLECCDSTNTYAEAQRMRGWIKALKEQAESFAPSSTAAAPDVPLCANHADAWFCGRNHLPSGYDYCVVCCFHKAWDQLHTPSASGAATALTTPRRDPPRDWSQYVPLTEGRVLGSGDLAYAYATGCSDQAEEIFRALGGREQFDI